MSALIAIIEDEEDLLELLEYNLQKEGFESVGFLSTKNVENLLKEEDVDLLIVDRNLPGVEGSDFIKEMREKGFLIPVIFLTAKDAEDDILDGFLKGGDDYITKPFNMRELILRVKAIIKRTKHSDEKSLQYRDIIINIKAREVLVDSVAVELTKLEFDLLVTLIKNKNVVLSRDYLLENVWQNDELYQDKTVNVGIKRLKDKIDPNKDKNYIKSVRGTGYTLC